jgi:hypothetical protein
VAVIDAADATGSGECSSVVSKGNTRKFAAVLFVDTRCRCNSDVSAVVENGVGIADNKLINE